MLICSLAEWQKKVQALILACLFALLNCALSASAQTASKTSAPAPVQPLGLDLGSSSPTIPAKASSTIFTAGGSLAIKNGQLVTPAQFAAIMQVLTGGSQTLKLDAAGRATGGTLSLSSLVGSTLAGVVVPSQVTLIGAQSGNHLSLGGGLINNGTVLALPLNSAGTFQLNALFIQNNIGAVISSVATPALAASLNLTHPVSLTINSLGNVTNLGSIVSNGVLSITSGGSIINGSPAQVVPACISGRLGTNLNSLTGNIVNSGLISSLMGNVVLSTSCAKDLTINNVSGTVLANLGSVSFNNLSDLLKTSVNLEGGLVEAKSIDFTAKNGTVNAFLDELRGPVDISAGSASVYVNGGNLALRNLNLSGDPVFANSNGDITLSPNSGTTTLSFAGQDLAVLASGDVLADPFLHKIDLSAPAGGGGGGSLFIAAGFQLSPITGGVTDYDPPGGYKLGLPSTGGGSVNLTSVDIDTSAKDAGARAGSVTIIAHDNDIKNQLLFDTSDKGFISVGAINAGSPSGAGGNIFLAAQADFLALAGTINTSGSQSNGSVKVWTGEPSANNMVFINGSRQPGGTIEIKTDPAHALVPVYVSGSFDPASVYGDVLINASGALETAAGTLMRSSGNVSLTSRNANIVLGDKSLIFTDKGTIQITAETGVDLGSKSALVSYGDLSVDCNNGSVAGGGGNYLESAGNIDIAALAGDFTLGAADTNTFISRLGAVDFAASGQINLANANITANQWVFMWSEDNLTLGPGQIKAGTLSASAKPAPALLGFGDVSSYGGVYLLSDKSVTIGADLQCAGLDMMAAALTGDLKLLSGTKYIADGGNIAFLASTQISGDNNKFYTRAAGQLDYFFGGVIELSAGFTFNPFMLSLGLVDGSSSQLQLLRASITGAASEIVQFCGTPDRPFISPALSVGKVSDTTIMGHNVSIDNNGVNVGLVKPTVLGKFAAVDVSDSFLNLNKGAIFFDAIGDGTKIILPNSHFNTVSYSVLSSDFTSDLSALVAGVLYGSLSKSDLSLIRSRYTDFSNINVNSARLINIVLDSKSGAGQEREALGHALGNLHRTLFSNANFSGFDTSRTNSGGVGGSVLVNRVSGGSASLMPLGILNDRGGVVSPVRVGEKHGDLVLFTTAGQVLTGDLGGSKRASIIGSRGATVSNDADGLLLHGGKVYANSGKEPMRVVTVFGTIRLAPETSAAIVVEANGSGRLLVLGSSQAAAASVKIGDREPIAVKVGEELIIHGINEQDGTAARNGPANVSVTLQERAPVAKLIDNDGFFVNRSIRLSNNASNAYQRLLSRINSWTDTGARQTGTLATQANLSAAQANLLQGNQIVGSPCHVLASPGTIYQQQSPGVVEVGTGSLFMHPDSTQIIRGGVGELAVEAGASAEIQVQSGQTRFRAYSGPGQVSVVAGGKKMTLAPGQEVLLQKLKPTREDALPHDGIARRELTNFRLADGIFGVAGDFSIMSSLQSAGHFRPLRTEPLASENKSLRDGMLKTATCLNIVRGSHGRFYTPSINQTFLPAPAFKDKVQDEPRNSSISYAGKQD